MPRFDRNEAATGPLVRSFSDGGFVVDGVRYTAVLMTPERALAWEPPALEALEADDVAGVLELTPVPEFLLLGSGPTLRRPPAAFTRALDERGIGIEVMDSRAGARTWGVLRAEERWIAAALMRL